MSLITPEEPEQLEHLDSIELSMARMERGLQDQERRVRSAITGFSIFAVVAAVLSLATLIVVATKLQNESTTTTTAAPAATAPPVAKAAPSNVGVALREFTVSPTSRQASAGKVTFKVRNAGLVKHEFVVVRTPKPAGALLKGAEADETGNVGEIGDVQPGATKSL